MKYFLIALLFTLICSTPGLAQGNASTKPPVRKFKHNSKVEVIYDKAKDLTTTYLRPMNLRYVKSSIEAKVINEGRVDYLPSEILSMTAYFNSPGRVPAKPQAIVIGFRSMAIDKTPYTNDLTLTVNLDGSIVTLGSMTVMEHRIDERMSAGPVRYLVESLELPVPYETFLRITKARKTKMILGGTEFDLENEHLEAVRDLIGRIE
jgi:hypothetical protein